MAEITTITPADAESPIGRPISPLEALAGTLMKPYATFNRVREAGRGHWWMVFALAFVSLVLINLAAVPIQAKVQQAVLEQQLAEMPVEQQAQAAQMQAILSSQAMLGAIGTATGAAGVVIGYALRALALFLLGLALGGRASFRQVWQMAVWTTLPNVLRNVVSAVAIFVTRGLPAPGLSFMFTSAELAERSAAVKAVLRNLDIYTVWSLVLVAVGMIATSRVSRAKGALVALVYWVLTLAVSAGLAAAGQALGNIFTGG
mgnify:CR=1 FL=1